jgi:hypothetical protein
VNGVGTPGPQASEPSHLTVPELEPARLTVPELESSHLTVPERTSFEFADIEMVKGPPQVLAVTGDLSVLFDDLGITISGREPGQRHVMPWADVQRVRLEDSVEGTSGRALTPVEVDSNGVIVRLLVDGDREESLPIGALESRLPSWSPTVPSTPDGTPPADPADATGGNDPPPPEDVAALDGPTRPAPARRRRLAILLAGVILIGAGIGLAFGLSAGGRGHPLTVLSAPDQQLAERIMLTQADLPVGWRVAPATGDPSGEQRGQVGITRAFAGCMGVSDHQAGTLLGGTAPDQTAQASSPIFVAPPVPADDGFSLQLQTAASIVRTRDDEQHDLALFADRRYPACAAKAIASELQLGVDSASGASDRPGPAAGAPSVLPSLPGEQLKALQVLCKVSDHGAAVPVEVEVIVLGSGRIEADLEAFSIGGPIPDDVIFSSVVAFEERVAARGKGVQL